MRSLLSRKVTLPAVLLAAGTMVWQAFSGTLFGFGAARFGNYLAAGGMEPAFLAILARVTPDSKRGTIFGLASGIRMVGILLGAILSGGVVYLSGVRGVFTVAGVAFLAVLPCFWITQAVLRKGTNRP